MSIFRPFITITKIDRDENFSINPPSIIFNENIKIRKATADDAPSIVNLLISGFHGKMLYLFEERNLEGMRRLLEHHYRRKRELLENIIIAEENDTILGICELKFKGFILNFLFFLILLIF